MCEGAGRSAGCSLLHTYVARAVLEHTAVQSRLKRLATTLIVLHLALSAPCAVPVALHSLPAAGETVL